jgi:hypothetical protein
MTFACTSASSTAILLLLLLLLLLLPALLVPFLVMMRHCQISQHNRQWIMRNPAHNHRSAHSQISAEPAAARLTCHNRRCLHT